MKRLYAYMIMAFLLLAGAGNAYASGHKLLDSLYEKLASSCTSIDYVYTTEVTGVKISGSGVLQLQGNMWCNKGNGLDIWCDGKTVWTADTASKEVIIDSVSEEYADQLVNPALMFVKMKELFNVKQAVDSKDGKALIYVLEPKSDLGIEYFNIEIMKNDVSIRAASFAMEDGSDVKLTVSSMSISSKKPSEYFRPSESFDSSWIVTDMR